ncbi:MAG: aromatic ring-hydroxylating dioxygenase subunit alpha [Myxococcaceae bacterium]
MTAEAFSNFGLQDCWTPVALGSRLKKRPLRFQLAGHKFVLFRAGGGRPTALLDRCPHRGAALSLGRVREDGCLQCPFHGWRFDGAGDCVEVPLADAKHVQLRATSFPVIERSGLLWVYTRAGATPSEEPIVPEALEDPSVHSWRAVKRWNAHWTRVMENLLDPAHLPYVHARTIGFAVKKQMKRDSRMELTPSALEHGFEVHWSVDGRDSAASITWTQPNAWSLLVSTPRRPMHLHIWCVPMNEGETELIVVTARDGGRFAGRRLFEQLNRIILWEDQRIVESQEPAEVPPPSEEKSTTLDRPTLAFRRWYLERKRGAGERVWPEASELHALH